MTDAAAGVLVVGYGNVLRADDGVGWAVAERAAADPRLRGITARAMHQLTPDLALDISRSSLVVLVDADAAMAAGEVGISRLHEGHDPVSAWSHHLEPAGLVALARELWGAAPPVFVVRVGAASLEEGEGLSPLVEAAVARAVDGVAAIVAEHGRA